MEDEVCAYTFLIQLILLQMLATLLIWDIIKLLDVT